MKSDQKNMAKKVKEIRNDQGAKIDQIMQTQELILQQLEKITQTSIPRVEVPKSDPHRQSSRRTLRANDTLASK